MKQGLKIFKNSFLSEVLKKIFMNAYIFDLEKIRRTKTIGDNYLYDFTQYLCIADE